MPNDIKYFWNDCTDENLAEMKSMTKSNIGNFRNENSVPEIKYLLEMVIVNLKIDYSVWREWMKSLKK